MDERDLDDLFEQARSSSPVPDAALYARISQDAQSRQKTPLFVRLWWRWGTMGGMAAAAVTGVFIGFGLPETATHFFEPDTEQVAVSDGAAQRAIILPDSDILALAGE